MRNSRQACHYYAKGHTACKTNPRRESLESSPSVAPLVFTNNINHPQFTRKKCTIIYHKTMFRNASYISTSEETIWKFKFSTFHDEKNVWCSNPISWKMCSSTAAQKHQLAKFCSWNFHRIKLAVERWNEPKCTKFSEVILY